MADRGELCRNLAVVKIKKHDRIKQMGNNSFSEKISISAFLVDRNYTNLYRYIILECLWSGNILYKLCLNQLLRYSKENNLMNIL